jgi:hypothetical protein
VLARALLRRSSLEAVVAALPACDLKVIRLVASPATVEARLRGRDAGRLLEEHLRVMGYVSATVEALDLEEATVANDGRPVAAAAAEVLQIAGWESP